MIVFVMAVWRNLPHWLVSFAFTQDCSMSFLWFILRCVFLVVVFAVGFLSVYVYARKCTASLYGSVPLYDSPL